MKNGDKIRAMNNEELAAVLMCPYETVGEDDDVMPCAKDGVQKMVGPAECKRCLVSWLEREAK